jgi:hypothetical protein
MKTSVNNLYSHDANAVMMTIPEVQCLLKGAVYYGPLEGADTELYEKQDKWYRVTIPCLSCLGLTHYDNKSPIVEVLEMSSADLL